MACTVLTDSEGKTVGIACDSAWGIGVYDTHDPDWGEIYGYPPRNLDPHDFTPDFESCSPEEIAAWEQSRKACPVHQEAA